MRRVGRTLAHTVSRFPRPGKLWRHGFPLYADASPESLWRLLFPAFLIVPELLAYMLSSSPLSFLPLPPSIAPALFPLFSLLPALSSLSSFILSSETSRSFSPGPASNSLAEIRTAE